MTIGIIGMGYVGLPLAVAFAEVGNDVIAVDTDSGRIAALAKGESYIEDVGDAKLAAVRQHIHPTTEYANLAAVDTVIISVPTPLSVNREPKLDALVNSATALAGVIKQGQLIVLESTTYPGTTREKLVPLLEVSGLVAGRDFQVAFSPERVDPGRVNHTIKTTPKVIGGLTPACTERAAQFYGQICAEIVQVSSPEVAELAKLLENIFRSVNIALVNELAILADRMGIDIWEVIDAAATKPFGFMRFDPGPGMGGHCLPVDPFYLSWRAREFDCATEFIELAGKINQQMPYFCVEKIERALNDVGSPVRGAKIGLLGVAYKPGVADTRESPALKIIELLAERGAEIVYYDPYVERVSIPSRGEERLEYISSDLSALLSNSDLVVIITAHGEIDYNAVVAQASSLVDLRGITRKMKSVEQEVMRL